MTSSALERPQAEGCNAHATVAGRHCYASFVCLLQECLCDACFEFGDGGMSPEQVDLQYFPLEAQRAMLSSNVMNGVWAAGVIVGIVSGVLLRMAELSPEQIDMLGFLGELMLRLLKMLVLPLVAGSMVAGNCSMHSWTSPCP